LYIAIRHLVLVTFEHFIATNVAKVFVIRILRQNNSSDEILRSWYMGGFL
jgi:hypothetical protein